MGEFQFEWWTITLRFPTGKLCCEYKGKDREHVMKQIEREFKYTNSEQNLSKPAFKQKSRILEIYWDTLKLDRVGYQRLY